MPYNPYNPYPTPTSYGAFPNPYPQVPMQANTYAFVNGVEGAKSFAIQPNQTVMLMDSDQPIAYMKSANSMGQATIKYYRLTEVSESEARGKSAQTDVQYALKSDLDALAAKLDALTKEKQ